MKTFFPKMLLILALLTPIMAHSVPQFVVNCSQTAPQVYSIALRDLPKSDYLTPDILNGLNPTVKDFHLRLLDLIYDSTLSPEIITGMFLTECIRYQGNPAKIFNYKKV